MSIAGSYIFRCASEDEARSFIQKALDEDYYGYSDTVYSVEYRDNFEVDGSTLFWFELTLESMAAATVFCNCLERLESVPDFWCTALHPPMKFLKKFEDGQEVVGVMYESPCGSNDPFLGVPVSVIETDYPLWKVGLPDIEEFGIE